MSPGGHTQGTAEDQSPASMSVSTIRPPPPRPPRPAGPARPHLHLGVGVHVLQLEPRVPVVVLLQVFLPDGHLPWKINAEETSHEGTNPPTQQGWEQSPLPLPVTPDGKSRTDHRSKSSRCQFASRRCHVHPEQSPSRGHCHGVHSLGVDGSPSPPPRLREMGAPGADPTDQGAAIPGALLRARRVACGMG